MPKTSIRQTVLNRRRLLAAEVCLAGSLQVQQRLLARPEFSAAESVALYSAVAGEVFTDLVFDVARQQGKSVVFPRVCSAGLEFYRVEGRDMLAPGAFGVLEPAAGAVVPLAAIDLAVIPGVAFDLLGHRLGYGKGYYDRTFCTATERPLLVGFAFDLQVVGQLPREGHDVRLDLLVTETRVIDFRQ
ncbi:5-formyltetrahydrofolate cyclo-ligase [Desulfuromonas carbonis]|uniref:5-formyltetrahydrofolate cyclo-ligase n=1 Tax=Desulfuromonas sp. DDH964 TaxID=1823759 RepID=UPI00078CACC3|nr:5-formyltetrahydrofolate cyclo-ligase [Desulfuromonas sp. DDH964]AMV73011.1 5-formyltetrahydrofolate cyclo-ligase [Desulfuromonas sp. DDH964]